MPKHAADSSSPFFRPLRHFAALACVSAALVACSPSYDWRTLHNDAGYTIDLPAKPTVENQPVAVGGATMPMRMQAAHVAGAVFAVGTLTLPDEREETRRAALEFLRAGLSRNLDGTPATAAVRVPLAAGGAVDGLELRIAGAASGGDHARRTIVARLAARGRHAYQAVVIMDGPLAQEQLDQFFGSFKLD
ncbi:hypothetical protein WI93_17665 [Burkholderia vietnamiensis]|uniref:hypothetical protein n=1 Tax=Burkholderia vietnamiensis TaxID=60552 RepID=UPI000754EC6F|nr:hypothetical protein [Burkholderia vietnamiensis]KVE24905.1 hypothetical protein WI93_17665 [Burkholderia vietnamiensis]MBR8360667.1 hypothetical protein [Burkholderia vietnamiensis]HDR9200255.1 hypothetical protein [Burkholderia vietnamiensis]HDR9358407.1 hypothetical protein [Burkholderia vietnamiensis]